VRHVTWAFLPKQWGVSAELEANPAEAAGLLELARVGPEADASGPTLTSIQRGIPLLKLLPPPHVGWPGVPEPAASAPASPGTPWFAGV
jgi:hypothetical protein